MDANQIPVDVTDITSSLTSRIEELEQSNALLKAQLNAVMRVMPADVWQALTNPQEPQDKEAEHGLQD